MIPTRLVLTNFRNARAVDWEIPLGALALIGPNGAGKSTHLLGIEVALFGPKTRSYAPLLTRGETEMQIELHFEHGDLTYRVRRGYSARGAGKTWVTLDVAQTLMPPWEPLTRETASETNALICELIGLSRESYRASAYSPQGEGDSWTGADPAARKAVLAEILALSEWDGLLAEAKKRRLAVQGDALRARGEANCLDEALVDCGQIGDALGEARAAELMMAAREEGLAARLPDLQRAARDAHTAAAQAESRVEAAKDAKLRRDQAVEQRDGLIGRIDAAHDQLRGVEVASEKARHLADHEQALADLVSSNERDRAHNDAEAQADTERRRAAREAREVWQRAADLHAQTAREMEQASARYDQASGPAGECPMCRQELSGDVRRMTVLRLQEERAMLMATVDVLRKEKVERVKELEVADEAAKVKPVIRELLDATEITRLIDEARLASRAVAAADGWRQQLAHQEQELAQITETIARLSEEYQRAVDACELQIDWKATLLAAETALQDATTEDAEIRRKRNQATGEVARLTAELDQAQKRASAAEAASTRAVELEQSLNTLALLERGYGRDGVPSLIVETVALPAIQAEANRVLERLASPLRVDLRSQRATKSGEIRDALDIAVWTPTGETTYETLSGGEATRINLALRIGLARLLATRRGAEIGLFAVDEPDGLDQEGADRLADLLKELARTTFGRVVLVSHQDGLRDALDHTVELTGENAVESMEVAA